MALWELFYIKSHHLFIAFILDLLIGDPKWLPHPIVGIGKIINFYEKLFRKITYFSDKILGIFHFITTLLTAYLLLFLFFWVLKLWLGASIIKDIIIIFFISQFLALKSLIKAGEEVESYLFEGDVNLARLSLRALVGRDTKYLNKKDIQRAILESYAENLNDGVIAPLFWLSIIGVPGLVAYKTINTLDSMVGYKNEKYINFGWFSAKMDDLVNYLPARITALLLVISTFFLLGIKASYRALKWTIKYAPLHPSPNSGYPESALAGALGIRLLGPAYYQDKLVYKPYIGENLLTNYEMALKLSKKLLYLATLLWVSFLTYLLEVFS